MAWFCNKTTNDERETLNYFDLFDHDHRTENVPALFRTVGIFSVSKSSQMSCFIYDLKEFAFCLIHTFV